MALTLKLLLDTMRIFPESGFYITILVEGLIDMGTVFVMLIVACASCSLPIMIIALLDQRVVLWDESLPKPDDSLLTSVDAIKDSEAFVGNECWAEKYYGINIENDPTANE